MARIALALILATPQLLAGPSAALARTGGGVLVPAPMRARAAASDDPTIARRRAATVRAAAPLAALSDDELWSLVLCQQVPRSLHVTKVTRTNHGIICPRCGDGISRFGMSPWRVDATAARWTVECPNCGEHFPRNDFAALHASGVGPDGCYDPKRADRSLLTASAAPAGHADAPWAAAIDDGHGWTDPQGRTWWFVAHFAARRWQQAVIPTVVKLADAYAVTNDRRFARKAGVLLARIAQVYPTMDFYPWGSVGMKGNDAMSYRGHIDGCANDARHAHAVLRAYDLVVDVISQDEELARRIGRRLRAAIGTDAPDTPDALVAWFEERLARRVIQSVKEGRICGNQGLWQNAMASAAVALDDPSETPALVDWLYQPQDRVVDASRADNLHVRGGGLPQLVAGVMGRDGVGDEGSPSYSYIWTKELLRAGLSLRSWARARGARTRDVIDDFPRLVHGGSVPVRWSALGVVTPRIGDSGVLARWTNAAGDRDFAWNLFDARPSRATASLVAFAHRGIDRIEPPLFATDPDEAVRRAHALLAGVDPFRFSLLDGYGLTIQQRPTQGHALWLFYGRNHGHGHADRLNIGLYALGVDMLPDLGYPEFAVLRPKDRVWTKNTLAHNTVVVDDRPQRPDRAGELLFAVDTPRISAVAVSSPEVNESTRVFARFSALVDAGDGRAYVVDLFRVVGGEVHRQSWHGPHGRVQFRGADLVAQPTGTMAGPTVSHGDMSSDGGGESGLSFLDEVRRARPAPPSATVDIAIDADYPRRDEAAGEHLRLHLLGPADEVALAHGQPPQNRLGNPPWLPYIIVTRARADGRVPLESVFATVLEPYRGEPFVRAVQRARPRSGAPGAVAVRVELADGRQHHVETAAIADARWPAPGAAPAAGVHLGFAEYRNGDLLEAVVHGGPTLALADRRLSQPTGAWQGTILGVEHADPDAHKLVCSFDPPLGLDEIRALPGAVIHVANDGQRGAAYRIVSAKGEGARVVLGTGPISLVRGLVEERDPSRGFTLNVAPGQAVRVDRTLTWKRL